MSKLLQRSMFGTKDKWVDGGDISGFEAYYLYSIHPLRTSVQSTRILELLYQIKASVWDMYNTATLERYWTISRIRR